ncbi:MAG: hypothetical protein Q8K86_06265 [Candidatus Nanopelagicaceae bacterium]|nr:hypothetical protein [Candidatus Nanopelagicaceae bacterium]
MSNSSRSAFLLLGFRLLLLLAFFPNAPPVLPRCGRPAAGRAGAPAAPPALGVRYGLPAAPVDGPPVRGGKPVPPAGRGEDGRAAKPGRTDPGRGPDIGGRGAPVPAGRCGGRGVPKGLLPGRGAAGRGAGGRGVPKGLLPGRGAAGRGIAVPPAAGDGGVGVAVGAAAVGAGVTGRASAAASRACWAVVCSTRPGASSAKSSVAASGVISSFVGFAAAFFAAAFLTGLVSSTGFALG